MKTNKIFKMIFGMALSALLVVPMSVQAYDIFADPYGPCKVLAGMLVVGAFCGAFEYCRYWYNKRTEVPKPVNQASALQLSQATARVINIRNHCPALKLENAMANLRSEMSGLKKIVNKSQASEELPSPPAQPQVLPSAILPKVGSEPVLPVIPHNKSEQLIIRVPGAGEFGPLSSSIFMRNGFLNQQSCNQQPTDQ
jgi:hypothetical protein